MIKWCELVVAIVILVFAFWVQSYSLLIIEIAAVLLAIHSFMNCKCCKCVCKTEEVMEKPARKKRR